MRIEDVMACLADPTQDETGTPQQGIASMESERWLGRMLHRVGQRRFSKERVRLIAGMILPTLRR